MLEKSSLVTELHQHGMHFSVTTKLEPNISKFKDLLDRAPKSLVNKFDYKS